jgi:hypothetical protein
MVHLIGGFIMQLFKKLVPVFLILCIVPNTAQTVNAAENVGSLGANSPYLLSGRHNIQLGIGFLSSIGVRNEVSPSAVVSSVESDGFIGSISYNYWIKQNVAVNVSVGVLSSKVSNSVIRSEVINEVSSVVPILFGFKYQPFELTDDNVLRPYIIASFGPFVGSSVRNKAGWNTENSTFTEMALGSHLGVAVDWSISRLFVLGIGAGYYLVSDFDENIGGKTNYSSPDFSLSLGIVFGRGKN